MIGAASLIVFRLYVEQDVAKAMTMFFATLITLRLSNAFNCRSQSKSLLNRWFFTNRWLIFACASSFLLMLAAIYAPFLQAPMKTVPLDINDWAVVVGVASTLTIAGEVAKLIERRQGRP